MSKLLNHTHEYERSVSNKNVFRCVHPDCSHYHQKEFLLGKRALCAECKNPFLLTRIQLKNKKPRCEFCQDTDEAKALRETNKGLEELLSEELTGAEEL